MADKLLATLTEAFTPIVENAGLFLEDLKITKAGRYSTVSVVVDLPDGPGEVDLEVLGKLTRLISAALDELDPIKGSYTLEVSSPGAERELTTARSFRRAVGHTIAVTTASETITAPVVSAAADAVTLQTGQELTTIAYSEILTAHMVAVL